MIAPSGCAVRVIDLPYDVNAMLAVDADGYASIYLNARHSYEKQRQSLLHELSHLGNDDVGNTRSIYEIEHIKWGGNR